MNPLFLLVLTSCAHAPPVSRRDVPVDGYAMVMSAATCWMGGTWFDAQGVPEAERKPRTVEACRVVERGVWGEAGWTRLEQLRAFEPGAVNDLVTAVVRRAPRGEARNLEPFLQALANAQREAMWARRAGDRVRADLHDVTALLDAWVHADRHLARVPKAKAWLASESLSTRR